MNRVGTYSAYQSSMYESTSRAGSAKAKEKSSGTGSAGKTGKKDGVQLSDRAKKLLEELKKTYGNMDFIVADYDSDEEASAYLSRGTKEYSVLIDPEELEKMASDSETKKKNLSILDNAVNDLNEIKNRLGNQEGVITRYGISIGKDGKVSVFAELEKVSEKQRERIEKSKEKKQEERLQEKREKSKKAFVKADSIEELLDKIEKIDWDSIQEERKEETGSRFDLTI